ncbi:integrase domain-containing protein [Candidatus Igneacidithiobacillus taiwanensis]|uniref:integrase domain-containing protein n=1 Tax=Candidatus Igneacidithiobacillus taiwanensis TaxID=1945924 RepID=UPI00289843B1|nr:integrase domain-containing protein [Candidatus Igneacidithiobacillus taiwanensis]
MANSHFDQKAGGLLDVGFLFQHILFECAETKNFFQGGVIMSRNYGIGTRDLGTAGRLWLQRPQSGLSYSSIATYSRSWEGGFAPFAKQNGVGRMERIDKELVNNFVKNLVKQGHSAATIKNYIAAINTVMKQANPEWKSIKPSDIGAPRRSYVRTKAPILDREPLIRAKNSLTDDREKILIDLARDFGLRKKEACLFDAKTAQKEAKSGRITISTGTKGGRVRIVPITNQRQIDTINAAARIQGKDRSMIPANMSYKDFRPTIDRVSAALKRETGQSLHSLRAAYACQRYREITGYHAPVIAGRRLADKAADYQARAQIATELGHGRTDVVAAYVGSAR